MRIIKNREGSRLTLALSEKLDSKTAPELKAEINESLEGITGLVFDLDKLDYISSAGLRVLLETQKNIGNQCSMLIKNVSKELMDIFNMTGFSEIMQIEEKLRQISIQGCTIIGRGVTGECYKFDDETVLKLYKDNIPEDVVKKEKAYARAAFVAGLPTAISYDVVACGSRKGVVYEILNAETFSQVILNNQDRLEKYVKRYSDICKQIHTTPGDPSVFPKAKDEYKNAIKTVDLLSDAQRETFLAKVEELPDADTCVHGDLHTSNILMQGEEPCLIDMGDFSIGYHMFDIGQIYNVYGTSLENDRSQRAVGMKPELAFKVWNLFEEYYFGACTEEERLKVREEASFFGTLRLLMFFITLGRENKLKNLISEDLTQILQ